MNRYAITLPALLLAAVALAGCGNDQSEPKPKEKNLGAGLGESYNQMLDEARKGVDAANRQMQQTEQRADDATR